MKYRLLSLIFVFTAFLCGCANKTDKKYSDIFIRQNQDFFETNEYSESGTKNGEIKEFVFPNELKIDSIYNYVSTNNGKTNILKIKRITQSDLLIEFIQKSPDKILKHKIDTVTYMPFESTGLILRFGVNVEGYFYRNFKNGERYYVGISKDFDYANFYYEYLDKYNKDKLDMDQTINDIPTLKRDGTIDPYLIYLRKAITHLSDKWQELKKDENNQTLSQYNIAYNDLIKLLAEIEYNTKKSEVILDTINLDITTFYEMDSISKLLVKYGFKERKRVSQSAIQQIACKDFNKLHGSVYVSFSRKVHSNRFELFDVNKSSIYNNYYGFWEFYSFQHDSIPINFKDYYISVISGSSSSIITIWYKKNNNYVLNSILDKCLYEYYGGFKIDTILPIDENRNLFIMESGGGDQGDVWGNFWIAVWEKPRHLKIVYQAGWGGKSEDYTYIDYSIISNNVLKINEKRIFFQDKNGEYTQTETLKRSYNLTLDTLFDKEDIKINYN